VDRLGGTGSERACVAWLRLLEVQVRAGKKHAAAAAVHARCGHPERADAALDRLIVERAEFDAALALHPEWASDAPQWPELRPREPAG
jgi:hypothetical protein